MSLQLGANFPSRWLAAQQETRQQFLRDLNNVCVLLDPKTDFDEWQSDQASAPYQIMPTKVSAIESNEVPEATPHHEDAPKVALTVDALVSLEQRLLKQADQVIERALDPIRAELKSWIQEQIQLEIKAMGS